MNKLTQEELAIAVVKILGVTVFVVIMSILVFSMIIMWAKN